MRRRTVVVMAGLLAIALVATGCVSKKVYKKNVEATSTRITGVESAVETNERRIADLGAETDQRITSVRATAENGVQLGTAAGNRASAAQETADKALRGKLLWTVTLSDDSVRFGFDEASVPPAASSKLEELLSQARSMDKALYFEIEGHTDNVGSEDYNVQLGEKRAMAVRNYLAEKGVPLHALNVISYGESQPVADNSAPQGRAQNRRVVIRVLE